MKKILFLYLIFLLITKISFAATYAIKSGGGGDYTSISECSSAASPGDVCEVQDNGIYTGFTPASGTSGNWITYKAATGYSPSCGSVSLTGVNYIIFDGINVNGSLSTGTSTIPDCGSHIVIQNLKIDPINTSVAISICADYVLIDNVQFDGILNDAVDSFGRYVILRNSEMIDETDSTDQHMDFWQSWGPNGLNNQTAAFNLVENNEYRNITGANVHFVLTNDTVGSPWPVRVLIFRYNKNYNVTGGIIINTQNQTTMYDQSIYNNTFVNGDHNNESQDYYGTTSGSSSDSVLNNIFQDSMSNNGLNGINDAEESDYNLYYDSDEGITYDSPSSGETHKVDDEDPLIANPATGDFSLASTNSPAYDAGGPLTTVAVLDTGSGTSLVVGSAKFFQDGWGINSDYVLADWIAVGTVSNIVQISSIDYDNNIITLSSSISRLDGDPVWLYKDSDGTQVLYGTAPDIGAYEYIADTTVPSTPSGSFSMGAQ